MITKEQYIGALEHELNIISLGLKFRSCKCIEIFILIENSK